MKRNSMLTKIIAVLLCALMVAAWLPKTSAAASDFESGIDRDLGSNAANAMTLVIGTNADSGLANAYYAYTPAENGTLTLTAEDGTTFTVDGAAYTDAVAVTAGTKYIIVATNEAKAYSFTAAFEAAPTGPIPANDLVFMNVNLSLQADIRMTFIIRSSVLTKGGYTNPRVSVKHVTEDGKVNETVLTENTSTQSAAVAFEYGVWAQYMSDDLEIVLLADKGEQTYCSATYTYSVKSIAESKLAASSGNMARLFVDMLNYGAAAQIQFEYREENLANADLTPEQKALATQTTPEVNLTTSATANANNKVRQYNLGLKEYTSLQFIVRIPKGTVDDYRVHVTDEGNVYELECVLLNELTSYDLACFEVTQLAANEMRKEVTAQIYLNGEALPEVYTASIAAVAKSKFATAPVTEAMVKSGDSVVAALG